MNITAGTTSFDSSSLATTNLYLGVINGAQAAFTLINATINPALVEVRPCSSVGTPTTFTVTYVRGASGPRQRTGIAQCRVGVDTQPDSRRATDRRTK
ncbi:MAG: hypothetical protein K8T25_00615 [Planctomycetia bacterium]|nr:hypothetical protein [Planctomycetia bacterium]